MIFLKENDMSIFSLVLGVISLASGIGIIYWINRRKFYRRNVAGLEGFSSYEASVFIRLIERICKWIAYALILFSMLSFFLYCSEKRRIERKQEVEGNLPINNNTITAHRLNNVK